MKPKSNGKPWYIILMALMVALTACTQNPGAGSSDTTRTAVQTTAQITTVATQTSAPTTTVANQTTTQVTTQTTTQVTTMPTTQPVAKKLVVIDAGHQAVGNFQKEPVGPGSTEMKNKVASGTRGVATGLAEYELNLSVALKLQAILEDRGYEVVMIRTTHDVNISNAERSVMANELGADVFIRIHANGSSDPGVNGVVTICQTKSNPYNGELRDESYLLSQLVLDETVAATGAKRLYIWETDTMTGINWCQVPVTIVEMGFMSNAEEDRRMATDEYQDKLAVGMANGIDRYFAQQ